MGKASWWLHRREQSQEKSNWRQLISIEWFHLGVIMEVYDLEWMIPAHRQRRRPTLYRGMRRQGPSLQSSQVQAERHVDEATWLPTPAISKPKWRLASLFRKYLKMIFFPPYGIMHSNNWSGVHLHLLSLKLLQWTEVLDGWILFEAILKNMNYLLVARTMASSWQKCSHL